MAIYTMPYASPPPKYSPLRPVTLPFADLDSSAVPEGLSNPMASLSQLPTPSQLVKDLESSNCFSARASPLPEICHNQIVGLLDGVVEDGDSNLSFPVPSLPTPPSQSSSTSNELIPTNTNATLTSDRPMCLLERVSSIVAHPKYSVRDVAHETYLRFFNTAGFKLYFKRLKQTRLLHCCVFIELGSTSVKVLHSIQYYKGNVIGIVGFGDELDVRNVDLRCLQSGSYYVRPFCDVISETDQGDCSLSSTQTNRTRLDGFVRVCPVPIRLGLLFGFQQQNAKQCLLACSKEVITWNKQSLINFLCGGSTLLTETKTVISIDSIGTAVPLSSELLSHLHSFYESAGHLNSSSKISAPFWNCAKAASPSAKIIMLNYGIISDTTVLPSRSHEQSGNVSISSDDESIVPPSAYRGSGRIQIHESDMSDSASMQQSDDDSDVADMSDNSSTEQGKQKLQQKIHCSTKSKRTRPVTRSEGLSTDAVTSTATTISVKRKEARAKLQVRRKLQQFMSEMTQYQGSYQSYRDTFQSASSILSEEGVLDGSFTPPKQSIDVRIYMYLDEESGEYCPYDGLQGHYKFLNKQGIPSRAQAHNFLSWDDDSSCNVCDILFQDAHPTARCLSCHRLFHYQLDMMKEQWKGVSCGIEMPFITSQPAQDRYLCATFCMFIQYDDQHYIMPQRKRPESLQLKANFRLLYAMDSTRRRSASMGLMDLECYSSGIPTPSEMKCRMVDHPFNTVGPVPTDPAQQVKWHEEFLSAFKPIDLWWQRSTTIGQVVFLPMGGLPVDGWVSCCLCVQSK